MEKSGGACLAGLECDGHRWEEQPLTFLVEWFFLLENVASKKLLAMRCPEDGGCFQRVLECD